MKYRHFFPCRARWKSICSTRTVLPTPGSPVITVTDPIGMPPEISASNSALPVVRRGSHKRLAWGLFLCSTSAADTAGWRERTPAGS